MEKDKDRSFTATEEKLVKLFDKLPDNISFNKGAVMRGYILFLKLSKQLLAGTILELYNKLDKENVVSKSFSLKVFM